jgi:hypothetical protein
MLSFSKKQGPHRALFFRKRKLKKEHTTPSPPLHHYRDIYIHIMEKKGLQKEKQGGKI